ncbi:Hypothetical predicted protein [Olea europaea subsp. europaea]|uniref:Uncharacterized protein n=1 Tax=Olea europaea subsp. europaea TaxID=158383 RepID=A0A8S0R3B6_OLEEU|nr:Hypothetical predicted protein [Olea europaea subsp. europaea]
MFLEINQYYCYSMSNKEFFLIKEEDKEIKLENSSQPKLENQDSCQVNDTEQGQDKDCDASISSSREEQENPCLEQFRVAESDDGFKTPTSLDHKIPVIEQCPPAPKKTRAQPSTSTKRKASPRTLQFDYSTEVESMFLANSKDDDDDVDQKRKKTRRDKED